jgi:predicted Zn-dependent peptidase
MKHRLPYWMTVALVLACGLLMPAGLCHAASSGGVQTLKPRGVGPTLLWAKAANTSTCVVDTWFPVGSHHEPVQALFGASHFLEHYLFRGTLGQAPRAIDRWFENQGALTNAATSKDFTHYYQVVPCSALSEAFSKHYQQVFLPSFPKALFEEERKVVLQEIRRSEQQPFHLLFNTLDAERYGEGHPYQHPVLGTVETIGQLPLPALKAYYHEHYHPSSAFTVLITPQHTPPAQEATWKQAWQRALTQVLEQAAVKPARPPLALPSSPNASAPLPVSVLSHPQVVNPLVLQVFNLPSWAHLRQRLAAEVALEAWANLESAPLQALRQQGRALQISAGVHYYKAASSYGYLAAQLPASQLPQYLAELAQYWPRHQANGPSLPAATVQRALQQTLRQALWEKESPANLATNLGFAAVLGDAQAPLKEEALLRQLTVAEVQAAWRQWLNPATVRSLVLLPLQGVSAPWTTAAPYEAWQKALATLPSSPASPAVVPVPSAQPAPAAVAPASSTAPAPPTSAASPLRWVEKVLPASPSVSVQYWLPLQGLSLKQRALLVWLQSVALKRTATLNETALAAALEEAGLNASVNVADDYLQWRFDVLAQDAAALERWVPALLARPYWDEALAQQVKTQLLQALAAESESPQSQLFSLANQALFPKATKAAAYGLDGQSLVKALKPLTLSELEAFWPHFVAQLSPQSAVVSVAGPALPEVTKERLLKVFAAVPPSPLPVARKPWSLLPSRGLPKRPLPQVASTPVRKTVVTQSTGTWVLQAWRLPLAQQRAFWAARVLNAHLGVGMTSALFEAVREERGLAYEVGSQLEGRTLEEAGLVSTLYAYAGTAPASVPAVLQQFKAVLSALAASPLSPQALAEAKQKLTCRYRMAHGTAGEWAGMQGRNTLLQLGIEPEAHYVRHVEAVTAEQVQALAQQYLQQPALTLTLGAALPKAPASKAFRFFSFKKNP